MVLQIPRDYQVEQDDDTFAGFSYCAPTLGAASGYSAKPIKEGMLEASQVA